MRNKKVFLIGSRQSPLAKEQTKIVIKKLKLSKFYIALYNINNAK